MNDNRKGSHALKHSQGRGVFGSFDRSLHWEAIWTGPRAVLSFSLQESIFLHFVHHDTNFYYRYLNTDNRNVY